MMDSDYAASPNNRSNAQDLEWAQPGVKVLLYENRTLGSNTANGVTASYAAPSPPPGTGPHTCMSCVSSNFQPTSHFQTVLPGSERKIEPHLDIGDFAEQAGLWKPLAANKYFIESMSRMNGNGIATGTTGVGGSSETFIDGKH